MIFERLGTALMIIASAWLVMLVATEPGVYAEPSYRRRVFIIAAVILVTTLFPRHLTLSGTVLSFVALGLALHIGIFGLFGMEVQGFAPTALLAVAIWLRRHRLDLTDIVLVTSLVACVLAFLQPNIVFITLSVVAVVNVVMWLGGAIGSRRAVK